MSPSTRTTLAWLVPCAWMASCDTPGCGPTPEEMERAAVEAEVFASDTIVTFSDGKTAIGAIMKDEHRLAVTWDQIPPAWVVSIVAAEDGRFWKHAGVDPNAVARAASQNVGAGTVVSGGSTLTQQTAKNLFDRPGRSLEAKWEELDQALHLEKIYSKREILTYYANLFHVTGNGLGLGVAARYFFDKRPEELSIVECAYIAGLVKGPANYDPFPGDAARQATAKERAMERTRYVLGRILEEDIDHLVPVEGDGRDITKADVEKIRAEAKALLDKGFELPFSRGTFRYDTSTLMDEVNRRLATPEFKTILGEIGVTNLETAGLTVVTSLDPHIQHEATYSLWHHLSDLGTMLEKIGATAFVQADGSPPAADPNHPPERHEFRTAAITSHVAEGGNHLEADLGGFPCVIDRDAIVRAAVAVHRGKVENRYASVPTADVDALAAGIPDGAVVWTSVREVPASGPALCDLEVRPELQGAVVVVQDGRMRAMVGGNTGQHFNRATAPRQMGSTFKPLVYHAAMTLGWQADDVVDNRRNVFPFSGTFYHPSPDHEPSDWVSMAWAGVRSENLASIWLLHHLTDHLSGAEIRRLAETLDLARRPDEDADAYKKRIQEAGVLPTPARVPESHFILARREAWIGLLAQGMEQEANELRSLYYGWGFDNERKKTSSSTQKRALEASWLRLEPMRASCGSQYDALDRALSRGDSPSGVQDLSLRVENGEVKVACGTRPSGFSSVTDALRGGSVGPATGAGREPAPEPEPDEPAKAKGKSKGKSKGKTKANSVPQHPSTEEPAPRALSQGQSLPPKSEMIVDNRLTLGTLDAIADAMERQRMLFETANHDLYDPEILYNQQDFRVLLSIRYVTHLAKTYGVKTELAQVMSLPLGASEITIEEAARMYEGITSGQSWDLVGEGLEGEVSATADPTILIEEIRDLEGQVIYRAKPAPVRVASTDAGQMTADILRNVVQHGTGTAALDAASSGSARVPLGGKTGTTNDFKNAAFVGYLPGAVQGGYSAADGSIVAVYVGYDDNRPMKVGGIVVSGAVGALPAWIGTVQGIHETNPGKGISGASPENGTWPLAHDPGLVVVEVVADGLPAESGGSVIGTVLTRTKRAPAEDPGAIGQPDGGNRTVRSRKNNKKKASWWKFW